MGKEPEGGDQERGWCTATGQLWCESPAYSLSIEESWMGKAMGCDLGLWSSTLQEAPVSEQGLSHHGRGNSPCSLCDAASLKASVIKHNVMLSNYCGKLGLAQKTDLEQLLCRLVDLDISHFVAL